MSGFSRETPFARLVVSQFTIGEGGAGCRSLRVHDGGDPQARAWYQLVAHGQKAAWLAQRGLRYHHVIKWRKAVFGGNLDRGLCPGRLGG